MTITRVIHLWKGITWHLKRPRTFWICLSYTGASRGEQLGLWCQSVTGGGGRSTSAFLRDPVLCKREMYVSDFTTQWQCPEVWCFVLFMLNKQIRANRRTDSIKHSIFRFLSRWKKKKICAVMDTLMFTLEDVCNANTGQNVFAMYQSAESVLWTRGS